MSDVRELNGWCTSGVRVAYERFTTGLRVVNRLCTGGVCVEKRIFCGF